MITVSGTLPVGLDFAGKTHKDFELRPAKVKDTIETMESVGKDENLKFMLAIIAKQLVRLGDIPKENITGALLIDLFDVDLAELHEKQAELEKKLRPPKTA